MGYGFGFIIWIILCIVLGFAGSKRRIGGAGAFFLSLILSPLIGFIIVMVSEKLEDSRYFLVWADGTVKPTYFNSINRNVPFIYKNLGGEFEVYLKRGKSQAEAEKLGTFAEYSKAKNFIIQAYKEDKY